MGKLGAVTCTQVSLLTWLFQILFWPWLILLFLSLSPQNGTGSSSSVREDKGCLAELFWALWSLPSEAHENEVSSSPSP